MNRQQTVKTYDSTMIEIYGNTITMYFVNYFHNVNFPVKGKA